MNQAYRDYVNNCAAYAHDFLNENKHLFIYIKNGKRERVGVVLAVKAENKIGGGEIIHYGYSRCHSSKDRFDKAIGMKKAIDRLNVPGISLWTTGLKHPRRVLRAFKEIQDRSIKYFKDIKK